MKFLKFIVALLLLPALAASAHFTCRTVLICLALQDKIPWSSIIALALGFSTMFSIYMALPRWNWLYVFGHETTHALAVLVSGGRVSGFRISSSGGHIVSDTITTWIALAPYIIPFYPMLTGVVWFLVRLFWPAAYSWEWAFLIFWGATWGFHFCFTASLLKTEQPDFASQGYFFSFVIILIFNLLILSALLWLWLQPDKWRDGVWTLYDYNLRYYRACAAQCAALYRLVF